MSVRADKIIDELVEKTGIRLTEQRKKIIKTFIQNSNKHLSVDDIYLLTKKDGYSMGIATVYRTVDLLEKKGVVIKRDFGGESAKYEFKFKDKGEHYHLICKKCGKVDEIKGLLPDNLSGILLEEKGFKVIDSCLQIYGYCKVCREKYDL